MKDRLKALGERALQIKDGLNTEEATKQALVLPFLQALGYDIFNHLEVVPEYAADFNTKSGEKVDYAILKNEEPVILIECKHWKESLEKYKGQLSKYFAAISTKKIGILTNGIQYQLYADLDKENLKDEKPFLEFDITAIKEAQFEEISKLQKSALDMETLVSSANKLKHTNELKQAINEELTNPTPDFIRYFIKRVNEGPLTEKKYTYFETLVKSSLKQVIDDMFAERINKAFAQKDEQAEVAAPEEEEDGVITTEEELAAYAIIKAIGCAVVPASRIQYKDVKDYFGINIDGNTWKTFCRLRFGKTKRICPSKKGEKETILHIENLEDIYNHKDAILEAISTYITS